MGSALMEFVHKPSEVRIHLGGTACDINGFESTGIVGIQTVLQGFPGHNFLAVRTGIHMAVLAGHVTHIPYVNLKNVESGRRERVQPGIIQLFFKTGQAAKGLRPVAEELQFRVKNPVQHVCYS